MQIFLILALVIAILAVIFAVQNVAVVTISLFAWNIETSLAVALLIALGAGVLITLLLSVPGRIKGGWNSVSQKKKYSKLGAERDLYMQKVDTAVADRDKYLQKLEASEIELTNLEEQLASLSAALQEKEGDSIATLTASDLTPDIMTPSVTSTDMVDEKPAE